MYARLRNFLDLARRWQNHGERPHTARLRECLNGGLQGSEDREVEEPEFCHVFNPLRISALAQIRDVNVARGGSRGGLRRQDSVTT